MSLDALVGATIDPAPLHEPTISRTSPNATRDLRTPSGLKLPSFDLLGISSRHPDQFRDGLTTSPCFSDVGGGQDPYAASMGDFDDSDHDDDSPSGAHDSANPSSDASPKARVKIGLQQFVTTLTPPDEGSDLAWTSIPTVNTGSMHSPATDADTSSQPQADVSGSQSSSQPTVKPSATQPRIQISRTDSDTQRSSWLDEACDVMSRFPCRFAPPSILLTMAIVSPFHSSTSVEDPIQVLSHALPCPSSTGFAFPKIINSLHNLTPGTPTHWINVFHALPGRYNLAELPTSPPGTPGQAIGGDDYFTSKVFDSAVPVLDYQESSTLPRTPRPVVPPASINVSIVERYIPPTNAREFAEIFHISGRSLLVDRMVELSPRQGTLCFIYPTKRGAQTFMRQYLSPILDPLLRSMCIINGLSVDLGSDLGTMAAVDEMYTFETMSRRIQTLCQDLSPPTKENERSSGRRARYTLQYASKQEVLLDRKAWADNWWIKQEKPRVREVLARYFRMARRLPVDSDVTPTNLIHEVLDGVSSRPYGRNPEPTSGVEVGVFVIRRTS